MCALYDEDPYAWFAKQASLIKERQFDKLDVDNLCEELLEMGESYARELESNLIILFLHLLKIKYQPEKKTKSWDLSIEEHLRRIRKRLSKTPSLKYRLYDIAEDAYMSARLEACKETGLDPDVFPSECEWKLDKLL